MKKINESSSVLLKEENIKIEEDFSLKKYNTFGVDVKAKYFVEIKKEQDLVELFNKDIINNLEYLVLGGGSNILFKKNYEGLVIHMNIDGIELVYDENKVYVKAGGGVIWNDLVWFCIENNLWGVENLTLIPGTVGAAPVQNIGAYGTEIKDVLYSCKAFDTKEKEFITFYNEECNFGYRDSIFKQNPGRFIITEVILELKKEESLNVSYFKIREKLEEKGIEKPTLKEIANIVIEIRNSRIPNPSEVGNAGSFFKNPVVLKSKLKEFQKEYPDIPFFEYEEETVKIPAGWLIEQCGWKGKDYKGAGVWKNHALILVNHKEATGEEIYELSEIVISDVYKKFGIILEREVNII